uniref:tRNA (32-2'-O)-methyltransferase regulator THADA n=2 Tax=Melanaphis sacchari TaxID=742174 RepID=A0A2H8TRY6_9HEMI
MYGLIHTIRHLLNTLNWQNHCLKDTWTTFIENLSTICLKCEKLVSIVVNDSSPEGIIPMDDLYQNDCQVTSQMVLLCCWRTAKESSLLLADVVSIIETQDSDFSNTLITEICSCLTLLLSETKHRGAFEQIYVAYLKVCSIMWKSPTLHKIPLKYLEDVLTEIKTGLDKSFCVTRRSAGMPFIIQALICTNHDKRKNVNYTMETLISICENKNINEDLKVGVVHALNVLRALFRCSQLGDLVGPFVSRAIDISIVLFNSSSWPIRNSSTLLLSALVNRVFGVPRSSTEISWKNRMTGREFFQRYPELYDTFLNEFKKFSPMDMRPSLYPTLLILARLYPTVNEATDCIFQLAIYIPYIFKCAQSPVMKTRMLAAISIAPQVTQNKLVEHLYITYNELTMKRLKENTTHGLLLQMLSLVKNLPKLVLDDLDKLVSLTKDLITNYDQFTNCSLIVQEVFLKCITCLWLQLDNIQYNDSVKQFCALVLESIKKLVQTKAIGQSKYLESATLLLFAISLKAQTDFSIVVYNIMNNRVHCETVFKILGIILSEKPVEICDDLDNFKNLYWDRKVLADQLMANKSLMEIICQQCTLIDSSIDMKYLVLSKLTSVLHMYFRMYDSIDNFISKLFNIRRDSEIAQALLCINGYLYTLKFLNQSMIENLTNLFDNIYCDQRSDECKNACLNIIVNNYNLLIESNSDVIIFVKLWNIIIHYSEDNNEEVRNHVWRLMNKDTNCTKSFELLFDKFTEHFEQFPSAVLVALIYWSYLDVELSQDRPEGQVFDGGDTSEFKEHTIRRALALKTIIYLTNNNPQSINLDMSKYLKEWIIEEWTTDYDEKLKVLNLKTVKDFMTYSKNFYSITSKLINKPMSLN